jgi:hypothetical protein
LRNNEDEKDKRMLTKRTDEEIVARIQSVCNHVFDFQTGDLLPYLSSFEVAKPFLADEVTEEQFNEFHKEAIDPAQQARDYLEFAWDKANNCRGLSASRSVDHLKAWLWLAGYDGVDEDFDKRYQFYGKPCLVVASIMVGFSWKAHDDGNWTNYEGTAGIDEQQKQQEINDAQEAAWEIAKTAQATEGATS